MHSNAAPAAGSRRQYRPPASPRPAAQSHPNRGPRGAHAPGARRDPDMRFNRLGPGERRGAARVIQRAPDGWFKSLPAD